MPLYAEESKMMLNEQKGELLAFMDAHFSFMKRLLHDDDWSFVIKAQALVEAALTDLLVAHAGDDRLKPIYEKLPIANEETGKVKLGESLGLLSKTQRRYIRALSSLRNKLAHRVEYLDFKFQDHIEKLPKNELKAWCEAVVWFKDEGTSAESWRAIAKNNPKMAVWMATMLLAADFGMKSKDIKFMRQVDAAALRTAEQLYEKLAGNFPESQA